MPGNALDGMRRDLRQAILASFNSDRLELFLKDIEFPYVGELADSNFAARVDSLIDLAFRSGWLIKLLRALEAEPKDRTAHTKIVNIRKRLIDRDPRKLTVVLSSHGTEREWAQNILEQGGFFKALDPCDDPIVTLDRSKPSEENSARVLREIDDAKLFVGIISKRYKAYQDSITEFEHAFGRLESGPDGRPPARRVVALAVDEDSRDWLILKRNELKPACRPCLVVEELFDGEKRKSIARDGVTDYAVRDQISSAGERLRAYFDETHDDPVPAEDDPVPPEPVKPPVPPAVAPGAVIILGEPKGESAPDTILAADELAKELARHKVVAKRWDDGWRAIEEANRRNFESPGVRAHGPGHIKRERRSQGPLRPLLSIEARVRI